jgi:hypothetical protein
MREPVLSVPPADSRIAALLPGAYFYDAWSVPAGQPELSALDQFLKASARTPRWVSACMALRNRVVSWFGLKHLGALENVKTGADYHPGERVGIFTLFENSFDEVLLGDRDKHLDVVLSVHRSRPGAGQEVVLTLTTVVHLHNLLGRLYMIPVTPMHRIIAPAVLRAVAAKG